ncbi:S8 family peptidase [Sutcliffiella sp. NC1]|uniref:S8 family peptidase n=1 Tax=Sutcliffiella sp. NC1 TaxID=3004096 RepID=UPI0022DE7B66|nr:S8 family serine peptidase [Sutcliffiella sp. NC1]WBL15110.1 S8 family serine peptidase [Sutcliffiella sp. NC1]
MQKIITFTNLYLLIFILAIIFITLLMLKIEKPKEFVDRDLSYQSTLLAQVNADYYIETFNEDYISQVKIGILDTGIFEHPNLNIYMLNDYNKNDELSHGVGVMGMIGAYKTSSNSYEGLLPGVMLYAYNVPSNQLTTTNLSLGIDKLVEAGVDIINISLSTSVNDPQLYNSVKSAIKEGVTIICSSGNSGDNSLYYPAAYELPGVISVGALNNDMDIIQATTVNNLVDIFAPGENIKTLDREPEVITEYSGTSIATPIITSFAAILKSNCQSITPEEIEQNIKENSTVYIGRWRGFNKTINLLNVDKLDLTCTFRN